MTPYCYSSKAFKIKIQKDMKLVEQKNLSFKNFEALWPWNYFNSSNSSVENSISV